MPSKPLLVFDTNIIVDVWLGRDGDAAALLVDLAETGNVELVVPAYVLLEFRGTALRWIRDATKQIETLRQAANMWGRCTDLGTATEHLRLACNEIDEQLEEYRFQIDEVLRRFSRVAHVPEHTPEIHFRGDLRYLSGYPPDRPVDGLKDCRIYEALLTIARSDKKRRRRLRFFVTKDSDFRWNELLTELTALGFTVRDDPGRLFGELKAPNGPPRRRPAQAPLSPGGSSRPHRRGVPRPARPRRPHRRSR